MPRTQAKPTTTKAKEIAADAPKVAEPKAEKAAPAAGATSGVMAPGAVGKAAREAAHQGVIAPPGPTGWRDPNAKFAEDDQSIDARMWRTYTKGIRAQ